MTELLQWTFMVVGITYLITEATVLSTLRVALVQAMPWFNLAAFVAALIYCPACIGFWVGVALGALGWWPYEPTDSWWALTESGVASMAIMATWSKYLGAGVAWQVEDPLGTEVQEEDGASSAQEDTNG